MNVGEIATRVKRQFGDEAAVQVTDADVYRWVNDALREIASNSDLLQTVATTAVVVGQREYTLPPDILTLRSVHYQGQKLKALNAREAEEYVMSEFQATGRPQLFWIWANKINLHPRPTTADPDDLQLYYTRQPAIVDSNDDIPELPLEYHNRIVEYCLAQAYELDENWSAAQLKGQQFTEGVKALKHLEDWENQDYYPHITSSIDDL